MFSVLLLQENCMTKMQLPWSLKWSAMWVYCVYCADIFCWLFFKLKIACSVWGEIKLRSVGGWGGLGRKELKRSGKHLDFFICFKLISVLKACQRKSRKTVFDCLHRLKMLWKGIYAVYAIIEGKCKQRLGKPFPFHAGQCICLSLNSVKQSGEGINCFEVRPEFVSCVPMVVQGFEWLIT